MGWETVVSAHINVNMRSNAANFVMLVWYKCRFILVIYFYYFFCATKVKHKWPGQMYVVWVTSLHSFSIVLELTILGYKSRVEN